jgi:hypothetical protein
VFPAASPSESFSFATKAASYRRFRQASAMFVATERDDRRIWSIKLYLSSRGNDFVTSKTSIAASIASCQTRNCLWLWILIERSLSEPELKPDL